MNKPNGFAQNTAILAVVGALVLIGIIWVVATNNNKSGPDAMMDAKMQDESMVKEDKMMDSESMKPSDDKTMEEDKMMDNNKMDKPGAYLNYSEATVASEQAAGNKVVLFFHASWCPFCKAANAAFLERAAEIPTKVALLKTDYDSNAALKQKYGVTYQHTFVQIDNEGNLVSKWSGGDIDNLKKYLK
jgi:thiol-disulfide isomerase/thioredoxin